MSLVEKICMADVQVLEVQRLKIALSLCETNERRNGAGVLEIAELKLESVECHVRSSFIVLNHEGETTFNLYAIIDRQ